MQSLKSRDITLVLGDFNAKIGRGRFNNCVGEYGLGRRNERGDRLLQFCQENDFIISNTFFKLPNRRLYTWKSPQDDKQNIVRNQIDYILINHRYKNVIKSVKTYPGADVSSDHNPLVARFLIALKKQRVIPTANRIDVSGLKIQETRQRLQNNINDNLRTLKNNQITTEEDTDKQWEDLKNALIEPSKIILTKQKIGEKQEWITPEILKLMNERRGVKDNNDAYKNIQKEIRSKIREAKEVFYKRKCDEIEALQEKHDSFNVHKKVKELAGLQKKRQPSILTDQNGKIIMEMEEKLRTWKNYIIELFDDERDINRLVTEQENSGPEITKEEVIHAIKITKDGKAAGHDELPSEILKLIEEENIHRSVQHHIQNRYYTQGMVAISVRHYPEKT
ncbi:uncharacterized protein LOC115875737 [Sitophilus oryzae]|uniref:Uncharacterized protein LOC115875737 n=1 Tax=Sitophilus oryzae TaxID=7048 RepID=A0A6J2X8C0_SITOR|nr:uncharacterized protein LOC115875737 [Sitophilus oryzae]